ncbi:hypothetical protein HWV62_39722 [Athelia sp. TMB]|nr:hypothetical protein HWV62_39722 [Athelia sp. TMB]
MAPMSPRTSTYERLEGGHGPAHAGPGRFAWKKFAIAAVVIIGVVYVFGPREPRDMGWGKKVTDTSRPNPILDDVDTEPLPPPPMPKVTSPKAPAPTKPGPAKAFPTSFETDPDPSKTTHCTTPAAGAPLVQWALMIDAGSTGSRIHIYKFNNCGASPAYEYEVFRQLTPGLSAHAGAPAAAAASLDALLDAALQTVPAALRACTPVAVKATAGLRLLGAAQSGAILAAVRARLEERYPFPVVKHEGVAIMDGKDEGVYAWITANYLLDTIRAASPRGAPSYAVLDLGGASTQIVFKPSFGKPDAALVEGEHKYDLAFGGAKHVLYQHSYLGYGLMRARASVHRLVDFMASIRTNAKAGAPVGNPCLVKGSERKVTVKDEISGVEKEVKMVGEDIGSFEACDRVVQLVMAKDAICEVKPCSFDGVYQPSLLETFPEGKVLLLSYFYDRIAPLISAHNPPRLTVSTIASLARDVCAGPHAWASKWGSDAAAMKELEGRPEYCLDLTFMHALLRLGYEFNDDREITIGKQIDGTELGWSLGAAIAMVGGDLTCRI